MRAHPVVLTAVENIVQQRVDPLGVLGEDRRPIQIHEAIGKPLRLGHVLDPDKDIVVLGVAQVIGREFASEPLVPVEIDLDLQRKPALEYARGSDRSRDP